MTSDPTILITDTDVRALAAKLKGLHALLPPGEQALLQELLRRAAGSEATDETDVAGFVWAVDFNPFPYLDLVVDYLRMETVPESHNSGR